MTEMFKISLPDGSVREMPAGSSPADVAAAIGPGLAKAALAARVDGELRDLARCHLRLTPFGLLAGAAKNKGPRLTAGLH